MGRGWPRCASQVTGWVVNAPLPFNQAMCWLFCLPAYGMTMASNYNTVGIIVPLN